MKLISTRDPKRAGRSFTQVLLEGLAPDGGLYVPEELPRFSLAEIEQLRDKAYTDIALAVQERLVSDSIAEGDLRAMIEAAYAPGAFDAQPTITPVSNIDDGVYLQDLSLGPTASFKDMAMQLLARQMEYQLGRENRGLFILGATSGDTGSAAEAAFRGLRGVGVCMLSPETGMSEFQKAQMGALSGENIWNVSIRGRFDDCQDFVKAVKKEVEFARLGAVNSINWGRIAAQAAYYFSGYLQVAKKIGDPVDFCVPTGNFGNALSCFVAKRMGVPIRRIIVATNENNVLDRLFKTGVYELRPAQVTSSPSMDISKASNYERLAFDVFDGDANTTRSYMEAFARTGRVDMADFHVSAAAFTKRGFVSGTSTHAERIATMQRVYTGCRKIIDPHTADGVGVAMRMKEDLPIVCLATALPVKFEDTVREALGFVPERPARFRDLEKKDVTDAFTVLDADAEQLKTFLRSRAAD